jgi:hypothetical protein
MAVVSFGILYFLLCLTACCDCCALKQQSAKESAAVLLDDWFNSEYDSALLSEAADITHFFLLRFTEETISPGEGT